MLDSPERISELDSRGMLDTVAKMPYHLKEGHRDGRSAKVEGGPFEQIIICGLGGSAIGGDIASSWLSLSSRIPCYVVRSYSLPAYVGTKTLAIIVSYSGDTEETLSMMDEAISKGAAVVTVSSGGKLKRASIEKSIPHCQIPSGLVPRATIGCIFGAISGILEGASIASTKDALKETCRLLKTISSDCRPDVNTHENPAKKLAHELHGRITVCVGYDLSTPIAKRWANQLNENAKMIAFHDELPEMNHNGIVGWIGDSLSQGFSMVFLEHDRCDGRMIKRLEATKSMVGSHVRVFSSHAIGETSLAKIFSLVMMGDYVSIYSALLRGVDPATTEPIDELKRIMSE